MKFKLVENLDEDFVDRFDENYYKIKDSLYYRIIDMFYDNGGMLDNLANVLGSQVPEYDAAWCNEQTNPQVDHKVEMLASELAKDLMMNYVPERVNEAAEIEVENPGLLEVPKGKKVDELPLSHFEKLVDKKGYEAVIKGLNNLAVWNKNDDKQLSDWAKNTMEKLKEKFRKEESLETDNADFIVNVYEVDDDSENFDKLEGGIEEDVGVTVNDVYNRYNKKYIDKLISDIVLEEVEDGEMPKGQLSQLISNVAHEKFWKEHRNVHHLTGPVQVVNKNLFDSGVERLSKKLGRILLPPR